MNRSRLLALLALPLFALPTARAADEINGLAALVNGEVVTLAEVRMAVRTQAGVWLMSNRNASVEEQKAKLAELETQALDDLIDTKLILSHFDTMGGTIDRRSQHATGCRRCVPALLRLVRLQRRFRSLGRSRTSWSRLHDHDACCLHRLPRCHPDVLDRSASASLAAAEFWPHTSKDTGSSKRPATTIFRSPLSARGKRMMLAAM